MRLRQTDSLNVLVFRGCCSWILEVGAVGCRRALFSKQTAKTHQRQREGVATFRSNLETLSTSKADRGMGGLKYASVNKYAEKVRIEFVVAD